MRIAIVNDMPMAIEAMRRLLTESSAHEIVWTALSGEEAIARCQFDRPDLLLMDLIMPGMDGAAATRHIMANSPCAILLVTATLETNAGKVFEAMGAGALDVVQTPTIGGGGQSHGAASFLYKIEATGKLIGETATAPHPAPRTSPRSLVAIGASAGGPAALAAVLSALPADFPAAIVIVQHVDAHFAPGLASWLGKTCPLCVRTAAEGDPIERGRVMIASSNDHLRVLRGGRLGYTEEPADRSYRPSVDIFFESVVEHWRGTAVGVLLTGMGRDGAAGLKSLRDAGHHTIAQDRASSAVYGMPKAAAELSAASEVLPLNEIAAAIRRRIEAPFRLLSHDHPIPHRRHPIR